MVLFVVYSNTTHSGIYSLNFHLGGVFFIRVLISIYVKYIYLLYNKQYICSLYNKLNKTMITLKTLKDATEQEVFDQAVNHLLTQNERSMSDTYESVCAYKGEEGLKCAAGCFISGEEYNSSFELNTWSQLVNAGRVPNDHVELISNLQYIHDSSSSGKWNDLLIDLAEQRGLTFNWK